MTEAPTKQRLATQAIRYRKQGLCGCGRPPKVGCLSCQTCLDSIHLKRTERKRTPGHCKSCGKADQSKRYCDVCTRTKAKARRRTNKRRAELGQCCCCQLPAVPGRTLCEAHLERKRIASFAYHRAKRVAVKVSRETIT
jgi:hypothetical protein